MQYVCVVINSRNWSMVRSIMVVEQNFQTECTTDNAHSTHTGVSQWCFEADCAKCRYNVDLKIHPILGRLQVWKLHYVQSTSWLMSTILHDTNLYTVFASELLKLGAVARQPDPRPWTSTPSPVAAWPRDIMCLSTRGEPRNAISAGQNFCHRKDVKWWLLWICWGRLATNVCKHSSRNTTLLPHLPTLQYNKLWKVQTHYSNHRCY